MTKDIMRLQLSLYEGNADAYIPLRDACIEWFGDNGYLVADSVRKCVDDKEDYSFCIRYLKKELGLL
jgi:hypothetical protein